MLVVPRQTGDTLVIHDILHTSYLPLISEIQKEAQTKLSHVS